MDRNNGEPAADDLEADQALRDARSRFVAGFAPRLSAMASLLDASAEGDHAQLIALREAAHKMAGLAGILGFPTISEHAAGLEGALLQPVLDRDAASSLLQRMGAGFTRDLSTRVPSWAITSADGPSSARILIVEDDEEQRRIAATGLRAAGYRVLTAASGSEAIPAALEGRPDVILLDVDLPGMDGLSVCRQLKLHPALAAVPVIFCTARSGLMDRMAGLTLGADDYVTKPFAPSELLLRLRRLIGRAGRDSATPGVAGLLPYDMFVDAAQVALSKSRVSVALVRLLNADVERITARLADELRRRDIVGRYSDAHLVVLMPDVAAAAAQATLEKIVNGMVPPIDGLSMGVADNSMVAGAATVPALLSMADLALAKDRLARSGRAAGGMTTVLIAEDDPDVLHIVDARLRAAGYRTVLALDGQQALDLADGQSPVAMVLDLMLPKLNGFNVLTRLRERGAKLRTIVISARGRDEDVSRAFDLGADDYLTKPFNPDELVARLGRLVR